LTACLNSAFRTPHSAFKMRLGCYEGFSAGASVGGAFGSLVCVRRPRPRRLSAKARMFFSPERRKSRKSTPMCLQVWHTPVTAAHGTAFVLRSISDGRMETRGNASLPRVGGQRWPRRRRVQKGLLETARLLLREGFAATSGTALLASRITPASKPFGHACKRCLAGQKELEGVDPVILAGLEDSDQCQ
jgi:hypothetical protein